MSLELYNTTEKVRTIPRYKYNGKMTIAPKGTVDIEDYMSEFFMPYGRVGIVIRVKAGTAGVETEEVATKSVEESTSVVSEPVVEEVKEPVAEPEVEVVDETETLEEVPEEVEVKEESKYTKSILNEKNMKELRDIAISLDIDVSDIRRKDPLIDAILAK